MYSLALLHGEEPKNARVYYFVDDVCVDHLLKSDDYTTAAEEAPDGSWCFLGVKSGKQRNATGRAAVEVGAMSTRKLDALEAKIRQRRAAVAADDDSD